jgi:putative FmdB family regulatory protein
MPLFEYQCNECGKSNEILILSKTDLPKCNFCGSSNMKKLLSAHSSISGSVNYNMPGSGDTACCGSSPGQGSNYAGPGSCCGRN